MLRGITGSFWQGFFNPHCPPLPHTYIQGSTQPQQPGSMQGKPQGKPTSYRTCLLILHHEYGHRPTSESELWSQCDLLLLSIRSNIHSLLRSFKLPPSPSLRVYRDRAWNMETNQLQNPQSRILQAGQSVKASYGKEHFVRNKYLIHHNANASDGIIITV